MDSLETLLFGFGAFAVIGTFIMCALAVIAYVVNALAIKKYLTALGSERTWAGWIPIFGNYEMFNVVADSSEESVLKRVFNIDIEDRIAKFYPVITLVIMTISNKLFDSYRTRFISNGINFICGAIGIIGLSASLAVGFAIIENKRIEDTRVFAVAQSIIGILFWVKAFQLDGTVRYNKSEKRDTNRKTQSTTNMIQEALKSFTGEKESKKEQDELVEEAVKRVRLKITPEFAESGGVKKIRVGEIITKINIPARVVNKQKVYIENYNSDGDDLEVTLTITEQNE